MAGFVRASRIGHFNESVAQLIAEGINHHKALKESLQRMQSHRGYNAYFESWTPPLMEDDSDSSSIAEMFAQETIDPRIESVLPILNRLNSGIINEIEEVNELDQWARGITEITEDAEERPYICYHTKKGKHECTASSSYNAAKKAADHWGLKSTAGIDAKLADVEHSPASLEENISDNKPDTIDSEMDKYFGSKPGELEEDSGCACGCGPKSKCTCDASCPKCDCGKDKLDENSETEGNAEAKKFLQTMSKRYAGRREGIIDEVKKRLKDIKKQLSTDSKLSDDDITKLKTETQIYNRYISDSDFDFQSPDPLSQAQRQSQATDDNNNQKLSTKDMEKRVMGTLAGPGAIAAAMRLVGPDAYSKKSTPKKYGSHKVAEDDSIDEQHDNKGFTDKENKMEETKSGGQTFAGDYKTGPAGQWRNTGKTKGRPAKVGDLVGASESFDPMSEPTDSEEKFEAAMAAYDSHGEEGLANALGMSLEEFDQELNEYGMEHGLHADDDRDTIIHGMVEQMIDDAEAMSDMRRLSGLEEAGKPTTNSKHSSERDLKKYDPAHGHTKPEGGNPQVCSCITSSGPSTDCAKCQGTGEIITPKRKDPKVDEAENSPDGNVGADDDGANDKYNQDAETVADRKSIQEDEELLDIIRSIKL